MMLRILFATTGLLLLIAGTADAQLPPTRHPLDFHILDIWIQPQGDVVIAVGYLSERIDDPLGMVGGQIWGLRLRSTDGGINWTGTVLNDTGHLHSVWESGGTIFVGGSSGYIARSTNLGVSFRVRRQSEHAVEAGAGQNDRVMAFTSRGETWRSTDRGEFWWMIGEPRWGRGTSGAWVGEDRVVVLAPWGIEVSSDFGDSWEDRRPVDAFMTALDGSGRSVIAVGHEGAVAVSRDGGHFWRALAVPTDVNLWSVQAQRPDRFLIGGMEGTLLRTQDGGTSWTRIPTGTTTPILAVRHNFGHMLIGGKGMLRYSSDVGRNWREIDVLGQLRGRR